MLDTSVLLFYLFFLIFAVVVATIGLEELRKPRFLSCEISTESTFNASCTPTQIRAVFDELDSGSIRWNELARTAPVNRLEAKSGREGFLELRYEYKGLKHPVKAHLEYSIHYGNQSIRISYQWHGPEDALTPGNPSNALIEYLIECIEEKFAQYRAIPTNDTAKHYFSRNAGNDKQSWWRGYLEGAGKTNGNNTWPCHQDYFEAVQNPQNSFLDNDLQSCSVTNDSLGLPKVTTGAFASVYQFTGDSGRWAVRCFNSQVADQHERYKAISKFILADELTYTANFYYLEDGIKTNGQFFPLLKMDWIDGVTLDAYIENNIFASDELKSLRRCFQEMMSQLLKNGIAHCDLQHGNILVDENGQLHLVDYDGMYVPELNGKESHELGHRNQRQAKHFGDYLDNFPAWIIDSTLLFLIEDPSLWRSHSGGDDCLLFREKDFKDPDSSKLFSELLQHKSSELRSTAIFVRSMLQEPIEAIPSLGQGETMSVLEKEVWSRRHNAGTS